MNESDEIDKLADVFLHRDTDGRLCQGESFKLMRESRESRKTGSKLWLKCVWCDETWPLDSILKPL